MNQTIVEQARVITALAEENKRLIGRNSELFNQNFNLIAKNAAMAATIRELRKDAARRGK